MPTNTKTQLLPGGKPRVSLNDLISVATANLLRKTAGITGSVIAHTGREFLTKVNGGCSTRRDVILGGPSSAHFAKDRSPCSHNSRHQRLHSGSSSSLAVWASPSAVFARAFNGAGSVAGLDHDAAFVHPGHFVGTAELAAGTFGTAPGDFPATRYLRIFSSRFGPMPRIASKLSTLLHGPYDLRICRIFPAVGGPIPGTYGSCSELAELMLIGWPAVSSMWRAGWRRTETSPSSNRTQRLSVVSPAAGALIVL
jgi:hypothetical protein